MDDKTYWTGVPCRRGHLAARYKSSKHCVQCTRIVSLMSDRTKRLSSKRRTNLKFKLTHWPLRLIQKAASRAKRAGLEFDLTEDWARSVWTGNCVLSGIKFEHSSGRAGPTSASIDRIDSSRGYTKDNCRFVSFHVNRVKSNLTNETFESLVIDVARITLQLRMESIGICA